VGTVVFTDVAAITSVVVIINTTSPNLTAGYHGMHVHVGSNGTTGESGCVTPTFASAGGHFNPGGATHGHHAGDLPSILVVDANGRRTGRLTFTTDRLTSADVRGRAVILHAGRDNFNNVPKGSADPNIVGTGECSGTAGYLACSEAALDTTASTGDAGSRAACGLIQ